MNKLLSILFVLVSLNCYGIAHELEKILILEDCFVEVDNSTMTVRKHSEQTNLPIHRFIIVVDKLEGLQDSLYKEILKVNLSIEAGVIEKYFKQHIDDHFHYISELETYLYDSDYACIEKILTTTIQTIHEDIDQIQERLRLVQKITNELTHL